MAARKKAKNKDLTAERVVDLIVADQSIGVEEAVQKSGAATSFKDLTKGTRQTILEEVRRFVERNTLPKEAQEALVMAAANQGLMVALQSGNQMDIGFAVDRLAKLTGMGAAKTEISIDLGSLGGLLAQANDMKFDIIDIKKEDEGN